MSDEQAAQTSLALTKAAESISINPRLAPQSLEAERAVLGGVLLMNEALYDVIDIVKPGDFYREPHRDIFQSMVDLAAKNIPQDVLTIADELRGRDLLESVGGMPYLVSLDSAVPATANLVRYARQVADKALARRLIEAGHTIARMGYDQIGNVQDYLTQAQSMVFGIEQANEGGLMHIGPKLLEVWKDIEAAHYEGKEITGISTGFAELDLLTGGLQKKDLIIVGARPSMGKAQPLDAPILTPSGWTEMGNVKVGSLVIGSDGKAKRVTGVFPQGMKEVFRVHMTDGTSAECCDEHLWFTTTRNERRARSTGGKGSVKSLREIMKTITRNDNDSPNHAIPLVAPVEFEPRGDLPLDPYLLGALLGDGSLPANGRVVFCKPESDVQQKVIRLLPPEDAGSVSSDGEAVYVRRKKRNGSESRTRTELSALGLMGTDSLTKFVPERYLFASVKDRKALIQGLIDTDGHVSSGGEIEFASSSPRLAKDMAFLLRSVGAIVAESNRIPHYSYLGEKLAGQRSYRIHVRFPDGWVPVTSEKHLKKWRGRPFRQGHRSILRVEPVGVKECQCIMVDSPDHLYVAQDFILTHNTALIMNIAERLATEGVPVGIFSLEMNTKSLLKRLLSTRGLIPGAAIRSGQMNDGEWNRLRRASEELYRCKMHIDDQSGTSIMQVRSRAWKMKRRQPKLGLIVIDYLQLMKGSSGKTREREQEVSEISRGLKDLAKELDVPVVALAQLNRSLEKREDKRPILSDLRESGSIEQDADVICFIHREERYDPKTPDKGIAELIVRKQRNGAVGTVRVGFREEFTRFNDIEEMRDRREYSRGGNDE